jgi:hypothetical protein
MENTEKPYPPFHEVHFTAKLLSRQPGKNTVFVLVTTERADDILCPITVKFA